MQRSSTYQYQFYHRVVIEAEDIFARCSPYDTDHYADHFKANVRENHHGTAHLRSLLSRIEPDESKADVTVASIHGSKGLERNRVRVCGDFRFRQEDDGTMTLTPEEARLLYVGLTRARTVMDVADLKHDLGRVFHDRAARLAKAK